MCRKLFCGIGLPLFAVLVGLSLQSAVAQTHNKGAGKTAATEQLLGPLLQAHKLLANANYDYAGHRAKAAQAVRMAAKELGWHPKKKGQTGSSGAGGTTTPKKPAHPNQPPVHEDQKLSDQQLAQAQTLLEGVLTQLGTANPKAATSIQTAITEITTALKVK